VPLSGGARSKSATADGPTLGRRRCSRHRWGSGVSEGFTDKAAVRLVKRVPSPSASGRPYRGRARTGVYPRALRAGLVSAAQIAATHVQRRFSHAFAETARRYERKAAGL
jgi:hypothetical protein